MCSLIYILYLTQLKKMEKQSSNSKDKGIVSQPKNAINQIQSQNKCLLKNNSNINKELNYDLVVQIASSSQKMVETTMFMILINGIPLIVHSKAKKLILARFFNKINSTLNLQSFRINLWTGIISIIERIVSRNENIDKPQKKQVDLNKLKFVISKIIKLLGFQKYQFKINQKMEQLKLLKYLQISKFDFDFVINLESQFIKQDQFYHMSNSQQLQSKIQAFKSYLRIPKIICQYQNEPNKIFNQVQIINKSSTPIIIEQKSGFIYRRTMLEYKYNNRIMNKIVISIEIVGAEHQNINKMKNHMNILNKIQNEQQCIYIIKFYRNLKSKKEQNIIYMENFVNYNLDQFYQKFKNVHSIHSKLFLLIQISHALRFLNAHKISYLNIFKQNISITKSLVIKLNNFMIARHKQISPLNKYIYPPQYTQQSKIHNAKSDSFVFGLFLYQTFFSQFKSLTTLIQDTKKVNNQQKIIFFPKEYQQTQGPLELMILIKQLCIRCLDKQAQNRPTLDWILIILRESLILLDKDY